MFASREMQAAVLAIAMLVFWTAATVHVQSRGQGQTLSSSQIEVLTMMAHARKLPFEAALPQP